MRQYLDLLQHIVDHGARKADRTGTGTLSVFGHQMRFDLRQGFPLLTTKKLHVKSIIHELLWFIAGDTNVAYLRRHGVGIWDEWADASGDLGPVYGAVALVAYLRRPEDRPAHRSHQPDQGEPRLAAAIWSARGTWARSTGWRCRRATSCFSSTCLLRQAQDRLARCSCQLYQRSADVFLGVPFNIASYALLTTMIAQVCDLQPGEFIHTLGDAHLYLNHIDQARLQLTRSPLSAATDDDQPRG